MRFRLTRSKRLPLLAALLMGVGVSGAVWLRAPGTVAQGQTCINSRGERVGEGARDGSFVCRAGTWVYSP